MTDAWRSVLNALLGAFAMAIFPLAAVIFLIWEARKVMARMQDRLGPTNAGTYAGPFALFQTFADAIKILTKELIIPTGADRGVFVMAPVLMVAVAIAVWAVIPLGPTGLQVVDLDIGAFYVVAISSLAPFSMIMAGWSSRNKYAEVGAFRAVSQIVGYEIPRCFLCSFGLFPDRCRSSPSSEHRTCLTFWSRRWRHWSFSSPALQRLGACPSSSLKQTRDCGRLLHRVQRDDVWCLLPGRVHQQPDSIGDLLGAVSGGWRGPWVDQVPLLGIIWLMLKALLVFNVLVLFWAAMPRLRIDQVLAFNWSSWCCWGSPSCSAVALVDKAMVTAGVTGGSNGLLACWRRTCSWAWQ